MKRQTKQGAVWGGLLILLGAVLLIDTVIGLSAWLWIGLLTVVGVSVFGLYLTDTAKKWALIIAYVLFAVAGLVTVTAFEFLYDQAIAAYILAAIALPFIVAFLLDRQQWGFLIPAYVLLAVGLMVLLIDSVLTGMLIPAYVMFAIALPFVATFLFDRNNGWALIPATIIAFIGLAFLFAVESALQYLTPVLLILFGVGILIRQFTHKDIGQIDEKSGAPLAH